MVLKVQSPVWGRLEISSSFSPTNLGLHVYIFLRKGEGNLPLKMLSFYSKFCLDPLYCKRAQDLDLQS